jgi:hypothetical protein
MRKDSKLSRRAVVSGLTIAPAVSSSALGAEMNSPDAELIALGRQLASISPALDRASEHDEAIALLDRMESLTSTIVATPAKTLQGLYVKARATAWALLEGNDFDPTKEASMNDKVAASIVRDLLHLSATEK